MILPAYHTHTYYCDGEAAPEDYITKAIELGLPAYGYSSHAPVPFETDWCIPDNKFQNYLSDVKAVQQKYADKIEVYLGVEIDYIPGIAGRYKHLLKNTELDYFIGSIHFVDKFNDGRFWNIDTSYELFISGLKELFNNNVQKAVTRFYECSREMLEVDTPDIIGHFDKIKMFNKGNRFFSETDAWYQDQINLLLETIKAQNTIVEINTRGYYKYGQLDLYPSEWILEKTLKMGIPVMINADAHHPTEINKGIEYAAKKMKTIGFRSVYVLSKAKWVEVPI